MSRNGVASILGRTARKGSVMLARQSKMGMAITSCWAIWFGISAMRWNVGSEQGDVAYEEA